VVKTRLTHVRTSWTIEVLVDPWCCRGTPSQSSLTISRFAHWSGNLELNPPRWRQSVSQSVIKQVGAAPIFTRFTRCGRATLTPVLEYLVTEPPRWRQGGVISLTVSLNAMVRELGSQLNPPRWRGCQGGGWRRWWPPSRRCAALPLLRVSELSCFSPHFSVDAVGSGRVAHAGLYVGDISQSGQWPVGREWSRRTRWYMRCKGSRYYWGAA
jgi:hypothetical protein